MKNKRGHIGQYSVELFEIEDFNWQSFRAEAVKDILCAMIPEQHNIIGPNNVEYAIMIADELIKKIKYVNPIPLTPEILEKNGFEGTPTGDLYIEMNLWNKYAIELFPSEGLWLLRITDKTNRYSTGCNKINVYIKYLHELQHALQLCGIDKEIKL